MTDRELLELAAKAIGMDIEFFGDENGFDCVTDEQEYWNPLTDDGDALRLAVKLGLFGDTGMTFQFMEAKDCAATRLATKREQTLDCGPSFIASRVDVDCLSPRLCWPGNPAGDAVC